MRYWELIRETATAGGTSAGNIASVVTPLWNGPTKGTYPYITPDYDKAGVRGPFATRGEPGGAEPFKGKFLKKKKSKKTKDESVIIRR